MVTEARTSRPVTPMSILVAKLDDIAERLGQRGVDDELRRELRSARELARGFDPYLERCTSPESPALVQLARRTNVADWGDAPGDGSPAPLEREMLSGHLEGRTLAFLVHATRARRVLEIGMFTGYSALAMAEALPQDGELVACEINPDVAAFARECLDASPAGSKISIQVGPAMQTLQALSAAGECFDLVFIDADKAGYSSYFAYLLDCDLLAPDGIVLVDNTLMQGQPWTGSDTVNGNAVAAFNQAVADDPRVEQVLLPVRDGLTLIRRVG